MKRTLTNNRWCHAAPSGIQGSGLFARADIPAGTDIVEYDGPRITPREGERLAAEGNVYVFRLNRRESIDGSVAWSLGRHANHACHPNAKSASQGGRIWLKALRNIPRSEEITYDYGYSFREEPMACLCRQPGCAGVIVAERHRGRP